LTIVNPTEIGVNESTTAEVEVVPLLSVNTFLLVTSTVIGVLTSSLVYNHIAKKPLAKIYNGGPIRWGIILIMTPLLFFITGYIVVYFTRAHDVRLLLAYLLIKMFIYGKLFVLKSGLSLHAKASVFHIVDISWVLWIVHWAFDPLTALSFMGQNNTASCKSRISYHYSQY